MQELAPTDPLCWILDNEWIKHYKECTLEELQKARSYKTDILTSDNEVLTDYQISKYWKADTSDMFLYFSLPKYPKHIQDKFKISLLNMSREQRKNLSYWAIKTTLDKWISDEEYYK